MSSDKVKKALEKVRQAKSDAATGLSDSEYNEFLEELSADAEGWTMELDERQKNEEGT